MADIQDLYLGRNVVAKTSGSSIGDGKVVGRRMAGRLEGEMPLHLDNSLSIRDLVNVSIQTSGIPPEVRSVIFFPENIDLPD